MPYKDPDRQREYQREWKRKRRNLFFQDKECSLCGKTENLCIHHRDPEQKITHKIWSFSKKRREEELAKCDVLCRLCHSRLHLRKELKHGTLSRYKKRGCRCALCRSANTNYDRNRRKGLRGSAANVGAT